MAFRTRYRLKPVSIITIYLYLLLFIFILFFLFIQLEIRIDLFFRKPFFFFCSINYISPYHNNRRIYINRVLSKAQRTAKFALR